MSEVTRILERAQQGDPHAAEQLLPLVYEELRKLAAAKMAGEAPGQTLQATALVHEAYLRLTGDADCLWNDRQHFFRAAAEAMRRILVDQARARRAIRRGGGVHHTDLSESKIAVLAAEDDTDDKTTEIHEALDRLARRDPIAADLVKLTYFVGLSMPKAAEALGLPLRSAERLWNHARAWLRKEIEDARR